MLKSNVFRGVGLAIALSSLLILPSLGRADTMVLGTTSGTLNNDGNVYQWGGGNSLTWTAANNGAVSSPVGQAFSLGTLTFLNAAGKSELSSIALNVLLTLTDPDGGTGTSYPWQASVSGFTNGNNPETANLVISAAGYDPVLFGGGRYELKLLGFTDAAASAPGLDFTPANYTFSVPNKGGTGSAQLWAVVVPQVGASAVAPEPASLISAAVASLAGLGFTVRRRRAAARA